MTYAQKLILQALVEGALTDTEISQRTGIPAEGVLSSIRALRRRHLVRRCTARTCRVPRFRLAG